MHLLTKKFQNSLNFIFDLGLQYVWIDSLCILQNFKQDWEIESGLMHGL